MDKKRLHKIAIHVVNSNHGSFLKVFADAYLRADRDNERILHDVWISLISKYNLDKEFLEEKEARL